MAILGRKRFSLLGFSLVLAFCCVLNVEPPHVENRLLEMQRDQMADALGDFHPKVIAVDAFIDIDRVSQTRPLSKSGPPSHDSEIQLKEVIEAFNELSRENSNLKNRIRELESRLCACAG